MISIIVPVYNIEKYVERCITSIMSQTYEDIEIILVDDGSTDSSGDICDRLAQKDDRILVIHKTNGGLSEARNSGLDIARGEYIGFVDGDDYISPYMYEYLYHLLSKYEANMAECDFKEVLEDEDVKYDSLKNDNIIDVLEGEHKYHLVTGLCTQDIVAWSKLYKREIFDQFRYIKGKLHEDQWAIPYIVNKCDKIVRSNARLYYYTNRKDAISKTQITPSRMWDLLDALKNSVAFFKDNGLLSYQEIEARQLCNYIMMYYELSKEEFDNYSEIRSQLHYYFKDIMRLCENVFSYKQVIYNAFMINPWLGIGIKKVREKR